MNIGSLADLAEALTPVEAIGRREANLPSEEEALKFMFHHVLVSLAKCFRRSISLPDDSDEFFNVASKAKLN